MSNIFNELQRMSNEYSDITAQIRYSNKSAKEMMSAISERLETERERNKEHIGELRSKLDSAECSDTIKHITRLELEKYQSFKYEVSDKEAEAVRKEIDTMKLAVKDARALQEKIRNSIDAAKKEIEEIRKGTVSDGLSMVYDNWVEGIQNDFTTLLKRWEAKADV